MYLEMTHTQYKLVLHQARIADIPFGGQQTSICRAEGFMTSSKWFQDIYAYPLYTIRKVVLRPESGLHTQIVEDPCYVQSLWLPKGTKISIDQSLEGEDKYYICDTSCVHAPELPDLTNHCLRGHIDHTDLYNLRLRMTELLPSTDVDNHTVKHDEGESREDRYWTWNMEEHPIQLENEGFTTILLDFGEAEVYENGYKEQYYSFSLTEYVYPDP